MKTFKQYLREFAVQSTSDYVFDTTSGNSSSLKIPISGPMFKRIWPDTIRATVFHTTDLSGFKNLGKLEGGKKSISAFFSMFARYMETGVATSGDIPIIAEMDADVLVSARDDIWSQVDKIKIEKVHTYNTGRREADWVKTDKIPRQGKIPHKHWKSTKELSTYISQVAEAEIRSMGRSKP